MAFDPTWLQGLALLETQGGAKTIKGPNGEDSNNLFNIKDFSGNGYRALDKAEGSRDAYRVYPSRDASIADAMSLLQRKYPAALTANSPAEFAMALKQGGYATDPDYANKLVGAINRVQGQAAGEPPARNESDPLKLLAQQGLGDVIAQARQRGYSDQEIVQRLQNAGPDTAARLQAQSAAVEGLGPASQLRAFREAGYGDWIDQARERGYTDKEIATKLGGPELQAGIAAKAKADERGFLGNALEGAKNAIGDMGQGVQQLGARITGDDAKLAELQAAQIARMQDLDRRATDSSSGTGFGNLVVKAAPAVVAGALTGGAAVPLIAGQTAAGALSGALVPTTADGQFAKNVGTEALIGGATAGAGSLLTKGAGALARSAAGGLTPANQAERLAARAALGMDPVRADSNTLLSSLLKNSPDSSAAQALNAAEEAAFAKTAAKAAGVDNWTSGINTDLVNSINEARSSIYSKALDGVNVKLDPELQTQVISTLENGIKNAAPDIRATIAKSYQADIDALKASGEIPATRLQQIRSNVIADAKGSELSAAEKAAYGSYRDNLTGAIEKSLSPEQLAAWNQANQQFKNGLVIQNLVAKTGGLDAPSIKQIVAAIRQTDKGAFVKGNGSLQDIAEAMHTLQNPQNGALIDAIGKIDGHSGSTEALTAIMHPHLIPAVGAKMAASYLLKKYGASTVAPLANAASDGAANGIASTIANKAVQSASEQQTPGVVARIGYTPARSEPIIVDSAGRAGTEPAMFAQRYAPQNANVRALVDSLKQDAPRLGYTPPQAPVVMVDSMGRASTSEPALFNAKYQPQAAEQVQALVSALSREPARIGYTPKSAPTILVDSVGRASPSEAALFNAKYQPQPTDQIGLAATLDKPTEEAIKELASALKGKRSAGKDKYRK